MKYSTSSRTKKQSYEITFYKDGMDTAILSGGKRSKAMYHTGVLRGCALSLEKPDTGVLAVRVIKPNGQIHSGTVTITEESVLVTGIVWNEGSIPGQFAVGDLVEIELIEGFENTHWLCASIFGDIN